MFAIKVLSNCHHDFNRIQLYMRGKEKEKKNHSVFSFGFPCNPLADANLKRGAAIKHVRRRFEIDISHLTAGVGKRQQSRHS